MKNTKAAGFIVLGLCFLLFAAALLFAADTNPLRPSAYNTYTHQAMAWRQGRMDLPEDIPYLELAHYQGRVYVSFPPVPSIPVYLLTFLFGSGVPDGMLMLLYAGVSLFVIYKILLRRGFTPASSAAWAFLLLFSSSYLPLMLNGAVWYQAQSLALMLVFMAVSFMDQRKPFLGLLCYALSVGCRPFDAVYGPLLILLYLNREKEQGVPARETFLKLLPGILAGLVIASVYALYNWARFGNIFEFGHNYLEEFSIEGGRQFALRHLAGNINKFIFSVPFEGTQEGFVLRRFGFSLFLANPALLLLVVWILSQAIRKKLTGEQTLIAGFFLLHLFLLLLHRTFGGYQYGARYAVDLLPYALLFLIRRESRTMKKAEAIALLLGLALAIYGSLVIRL